MLRFFRQIRQSLITDNKFSKYLLYADGDIFLLVVMEISMHFMALIRNEESKWGILELKH